MDSVDLQVLKSAAAWLADGHRVVLATVTETWGSSPRPPGAMLAVRGDGLVAGSVSGGCVEDDLIDKVRSKSLAVDKPATTLYGISKEDAQRFGLPCGGREAAACRTAYAWIEPLMFSGVNGILRTRIPVAAKIALPMAA